MHPSRTSVVALRERIPEAELVFTFARSGGPGGQNVNKVNTKAVLWLNVAACAALTEDEKHAVLRKLAGRIGRDGRLHITVTRHRTQGANRAAAIERFFEVLSAALAVPRTRRPTRVPRGAHERRLRVKREHSARKQGRSAGPGEE